MLSQHPVASWITKTAFWQLPGRDPGGPTAAPAAIRTSQSAPAPQTKEVSCLSISKLCKAVDSLLRESANCFSASSRSPPSTSKMPPLWPFRRQMKRCCPDMPYPTAFTPLTFSRRRRRCYMAQPAGPWSMLQAVGSKRGFSPKGGLSTVPMVTEVALSPLCGRNSTSRCGSI